MQLHPVVDQPINVKVTGSQSSTRPNSNPSSSQGQGSASQPERSSQTPAVPPWPREKSSINSLLNDPAPGSLQALATMERKLVVDHAQTSNLLEGLVNETSGCSVEQLEQIYSALMSEIWRTRDDWDRGSVARKVGAIFLEVTEDIRVCQGMGVGSMEIED